MLEHVLIANPLRTLARHAPIAANHPAQFEIPPHLSVKCSNEHFTIYPIPVLFYT